MNLSFIIPVYQQTQTLPELLQRIRVACHSQHDEADIILVDDVSPMAVWVGLQQIKEQNPDLPLTLIRLTSNQGQYRATLCGLLQAKGDVLVTLDADGQHPPEEIPKLLEAMAAGQCDLVYGTTQVRQPPLLQAANYLYKLLLHQPGHPMDRHASAFRCLTRELCQTAFHGPLSGFINLDEHLLKASFRNRWVTTCHAPRWQGETTYTWTKRISLALQNMMGSAGYARMAGLGAFACILVAAVLLSCSASATTLWGAVLLTAFSLLLATSIPVSQRLFRKRYPPIRECIAEVVE